MTTAATFHAPRRSGRRPRRFAPVVVVAALLLTPAALAAPSGPPAPPAQRAAQARAAQADVRRQKAEVAARIDEISATDQQLAEALNVLNENVKAQEAHVDTARRAAADARRLADELDAEIKRQETQVGELQQRLQRRAVEGYIRPSQRADDPSALLTGGDFDKAQQRQTLAKVVGDSDRDVIDQLRGARARLAEQKHVAEQARADAEARTAEEEAALGGLSTARDEQARVKAAVDKRLADEHAHNQALNAADGDLSAIIAKAEADQQAQQEAARRASASARPSGPARGIPAPVFGNAGPRPASASGLIWPIAGTVSQEFGRGHPGMDIFAPLGTPIWAAKGGTVIIAGWNNGGYGNLVVVAHGEGFATAYAHLSSVSVSEGQAVSQGQVVGLEGSTGYSTGPHLHFECRVNGQVQNPRSFLS